MRGALERVVREVPRVEPLPLATLDWDHTCMYGDVSEAILVALDRRDGGARMPTYERLLRESGMDAGFTYAATALAGHTPEALAALASEVADAGLADGTLRTRPELRDLADALARHGWEVWVVSASTEVVIRAVAIRYGIGPERVIGVRLALGEDGRLLPEIEGPRTWRRGKVDAIVQRIGRLPALAVGDAATDLEMLGAARHALVLDRGVLELRVAAARHGWLVQPIWER